MSEREEKRCHCPIEVIIMGLCVASAGLGSAIRAHARIDALCADVTEIKKALNIPEEPEKVEEK